METQNAFYIVTKIILLKQQFDLYHVLYEKSLPQTHSCCLHVFAGLRRLWCSGSGLTSRSTLSSTTPTAAETPP